MSLKAIDRLILIRVKTEWAKKRLSDLAAESLALEHTYVVTRNNESDVPPHPISFLWGNYPSVPTISFDAVCLAGEVVHSLRSALDHLAQQLALVYTPTLTHKELRRIEFPISETRAKYESDTAGKVKGISPKAVEAINRLKPYGNGDGEFSALLWRLHDLDNIDKHRNLFTFGHEFIFTAEWMKPGVYHFKTDDPHFAGVEADVEKDIQSAIKETVGKTKIGYVKALLPALREFVEAVDEIIKGFAGYLE